MDIYQLKTFVTVAAEGSITKASELLFLSQPAVSAHIKALEDELGLQLFNRTAKGMSLSAQGLALLTKAEQLLQLQKELLLDAKRLKGELHGCVRLGSNRGSSAKLLGQLLNQLSTLYPQLDIRMHYGSSAEIQQAITQGKVDAGFYTSIKPDQALHHIEVDSYGIYIAAPPAWVNKDTQPDWQQLAQLPWVLPEPDTCCGRAAAGLFASHAFYPEKVIKVDQEQMTRALIAGAVGIGLLHAGSALDAELKGEVQLLGQTDQQVKLWFSCQPDRMQQPQLKAVIELVQQLVVQPIECDTPSENR
nr:LysR family transcriptional regulator [Rheinheimera sp. MM224]